MKGVNGMKRLNRHTVRKRKKTFLPAAVMTFALSIQPFAASASGIRGDNSSENSASADSAVVESLNNVSTEHLGRVAEEAVENKTKKEKPVSALKKAGSVVAPSAGELLSNTTVSQLNGYSSMCFTIPDTNREVFIAGLSEDALADVQSQFLEHYGNGENFSIRDTHIIDTEKTAEEDADDLLCWAAATSNILHYSGWGAAGGFETTDDIFELFIRDNPISGMEQAGVSWFVNGLDPFLGDLPEIAAHDGYVKDYAADRICDFYDFRSGSPTRKLDAVFEKLREGYAVSMDITSYLWGDSHAVTVWGYVLNYDYVPDQKEYYEAIIISDSDSGELENADRREAANELDVKFLTPFNNREDPGYYVDGGFFDSWLLEAYNCFVIEKMTTLQPFETAQPETDVTATKNKRTDIDLLIKNLITFTDDNYMELEFNDDNVTFYPQKKSFTTSEPIVISPFVKNSSLVPFEGDMTYLVTVYDENGNVAAQKQKTVSVHPPLDIESSNGVKMEGVIFDHLPIGSYRAVIELNSDRKIKEAYYSNNRAVCSFEVHDGQSSPEAFVSFSIPEVPEDGYYEYAELTYGSFDEIPYQEAYLLISYYLNGKWTPWRVVFHADNNYQPMPETESVSYGGHMINFALLLINDTDLSDSENYHFITAEPQRLPIPRLTAETAEDHPKSFSGLSPFASGLVPGEQFSVNLINDSDSEYQTAYGTYCLEFDTPLYETFSSEEVPFTMASDEKTRRLMIDSWGENDKLQGSCDVSLVVRTYLSDTAYCTMVERIHLGTVNFGEAPSSVVNTGYDIVNPLDGLTSLREAYEYCKQSGGKVNTITFDKGMIEDAVVLLSPLVIDIPVTIDGTFESVTDTGEPVTLGICFSGYDTIKQRFVLKRLFEVTSQGELTLKCITAFDVEGPAGAVVCNRGGKVFLENCLIGNCHTNEEGGAIYTDGGIVKVRNTTFDSTYGNEGGVLYMTGNADVDFINTVLMSTSSDHTVIENNSGSLDMVYCDLISCRMLTYDPDSFRVIHSNGNTNIVACRITNEYSTDELVDLEGNINVYASIIQSADSSCFQKGDNIKAGEFDIYKRGEYENVISYELKYGEDGGYHNLLTRRPVVVRHTKTSVVSLENKLYYTVDGEHYQATGISAGFEADQYNRDSDDLTRVNYPGQGAYRGEYAECAAPPDDLVEKEDTSSDVGSSQSEKADDSKESKTESKTESGREEESKQTHIVPDGKAAPDTGEQPSVMLPLMLLSSFTAVIMAAICGRKRRARQ